EGVELRRSRGLAGEQKLSLRAIEITPPERDESQDLVPVVNRVAVLPVTLGRARPLDDLPREPFGLVERTEVDRRLRGVRGGKAPPRRVAGSCVLRRRLVVVRPRVDVRRRVEEGREPPHRGQGREREQRERHAGQQASYGARRIREHENTVPDVE